MAETKVPARYQPVMDALKEEYLNPKFSDLKIQCGANEWHVHKLVVCRRSTFFEKACTRDFMEAHDNTIRLPEDEPAAVKAMLDFLYTGEYDVHLEMSSEAEYLAPVTLQVYVHILADKYDIHGLADLAMAKFASLAQYGWTESDFADAINVAYTKAPNSTKELRDIAVAQAGAHAAELYAGESYGPFREVASSIAVFASDLAQWLCKNDSQKTQSSWLLKCNSCCQPVTISVMEGNSAMNPQCLYCPVCGCYQPNNSGRKYKGKKSKSLVYAEEVVTEAP